MTSSARSSHFLRAQASSKRNTSKPGKQSRWPRNFCYYSLSMIRGCLTLSGLGLLSLLVFGVTRETLNDPKELSAIPFKPWDFLTYGLIALGIPLLIRIVRKPDPRKTLAGKWISDVQNERGRIRTALRLNQDGNAEIDIKGKVAGSDERLRTSARWQILDGRSLHLLGAQSLTWKIVKLNSWSMTTAALAESSFPVHWIKHPKVNARALLFVAAAMVLPVVFALSLPRSKSSHAVAEDPQWVPSTTSRHRH